MSTDFNPLLMAIEDAIRKQTSALEELIKVSFEEHFGYPITEVKDTEHLQRITIPGDKLEYFAYRKEHFLCVTKNEIEREEDPKNPECYRFCISLRYKKL